MRRDKGVCYVTYGEAAEHEYRASLDSLKEWHPELLPAAVRTERLPGHSDTQAARWAKVNLDQWSPYERTLYLDSDTRVFGSLSVGFELLSDGFDFVITPSAAQGDDLLWHVSEDERAVTLEETGLPLQLQAGVFWFAKNERTRQLFECWQSEWLRWSGEDQGALLRALYRCPVRVALLGRPFNGGAVVSHQCGRCRRKN
jgi:hypothetical protein